MVIKKSSLIEEEYNFLMDENILKEVNLVRLDKDCIKNKIFEASKTNRRKEILKISFVLSNSIKLYLEQYNMVK
jgi:hypothetical protein